jgi:BMFP domain-containing protein YqiC
MTVEKLEAIEIDWTQGVAENFERVKSAALSALDAANRRADEAEARMYSSQRIAIAAEAEIDTLRARVAALEAGGCARDQGTTQYCAEAVALQKRVAELEGALEQALSEYDQVIWGEDYEYEEAWTRVQQIIDATLNKEHGK